MLRTPDPTWCKGCLLHVVVLWGGGLGGCLAGAETAVKEWGGLMLDLACRTVCGTLRVPLSRGVKFSISGPLRLVLMQSGSIS